ncbi:MAG TPA: hypothetical protein VFG10_06990 [Saprospiraceae bacterium]|nr:hypothetical protein [Saprospiraceae bacterium]
MNQQEFQNSIRDDYPPKGLTPFLLALWYDAKGDWESSHNIAQDINTKDGALIHAYLHRKEGDIWNADYWYGRAGTKRPPGTLEDEWKYLVKEFLLK